MWTRVTCIEDRVMHERHDDSEKGCIVCDPEVSVESPMWRNREIILMASSVVLLSMGLFFKFILQLSYLAEILFLTTAAISGYSIAKAAFSSLVFQKRIRTILDMENSLGAIPRNQRILSRPELKELFNGNENGDLESRNQIILEAFKVYVYTQSEIAEHLGLHKTTISKIVSKTR